MAYKYEIYKDKAGEYRVRFKFNSEVIWSSEGYASKASATNLIQSLKRNAPGAPVEDRDSAIADLKRRLETARVPAADRIVGLDHNSAAAKEFTVAIKKLEESIRTSNDLGELSAEDIEVARNEISQLAAERKLKWVRPAHIWQIAKSTLLWIFDKSSDAAFGLLALAVLESLAKLLGIAV